ncbi:MAG: hypothetical protein P9X24_05710 [Candidatus Hatepunaea meridiana]|nr:hypothetical protein [Candidatus Hatepunaea meridiana]
MAKEKTDKTISVETIAIHPLDDQHSPTIEELAETQGVSVMSDVEALFGTWPGENDDGFEDAIHKLRQRDVSEKYTLTSSCTK